jgi:hypothetical protein
MKARYVGQKYDLLNPTNFVEEDKMNTLNKLLRKSILLLVLLPLALGIFLAARLASEGPIASTPTVYDATGAMLNAVEFPTDPDLSARASNRYDATGAMLDAIVQPNEVAAPVSNRYDATGAMLDAIVVPADPQQSASPALQYDATGAMLDTVVFPGDPDLPTSMGSHYDATKAMFDAVEFEWQEPK